MIIINKDKMKKEEIELVKRKKFRKKFFDIKDGYNLIKFINKIPNLQQVKFRLSEEEYNVVGENENLIVIVIGRSGTGKTTRALMRMFSIQIIYKHTKAKQRHIAQGETEKYFCKSKYLDEIFGMKNIFLTASPFLIQVIRQKYEQLKTRVQLQLQIIELKAIPIIRRSKRKIMQFSILIHDIIEVEYLQSFPFLINKMLKFHKIYQLRQSINHKQNDNLNQLQAQTLSKIKMYSLSYKIDQYDQKSNIVIMFKDNLRRITLIMMNPIQDNTSLMFQCSFLQLFRVKLLINCSYTSIFEKLVFVNKRSVLLKSQVFNPKTIFCYSAEESQQTFLMKLNQVSTLVSNHISELLHSS